MALSTLKGGNMRSFRTAFLYSLVVWVAPFITAFIVYPLHENVLNYSGNYDRDRLGERNKIQEIYEMDSTCTLSFFEMI